MYNNYLSDSDDSDNSNEYLEITYDENNIPEYKLKKIIPKYEFKENIPDYKVEEDDIYCSYQSEDEICNEEFMKLFHDSNNGSDSDSDSDSDNHSHNDYNNNTINCTMDNTNLQKYVRVWIQKKLVNKNIEGQWEQFTKYVNIVDHKINKEKNISVKTSNKEFSLLFKKINEEHKIFKPNEYNLINKHIILQRRLEYFMSRHTALLYRN